MLIDGTNLILGRVATYATKKALEGEEIVIVNCEKLIITGRKKFVIEEYQRRPKREDNDDSDDEMNTTATRPAV